VLYVEGSTNEGEDRSIHASLITRPGTVVIDTSGGSQRVEGKCVILTPDGDRIQAKFTCTYLAGCSGDFELVGGAGEKRSFSGGESIVSNQISIPGAIVEQEAVGMALPPTHDYKLPKSSAHRVEDRAYWKRPVTRVEDQVDRRWRLRPALNFAVFVAGSVLTFSKLE
jgi:hypothetical protein